MIKDVQDLLVVQDRDNQIQKLEAEMRRIPQDVERENAKLHSDKQALQEAKENLQKLEVQAGQVKLDRRTRQDTVGKLQVQMFETKKNDEYAALGSEVKRYESQVSDLETEELELLEQCDLLKLEVEKCQQALDNRTQMVTENINALKDKARSLMERFKEAKQLRATSCEGVAADALALYERIFKAKKESVVVELKGDVCLGCDMKVVSNTISKLRAQKEITQCENCGKIMFEA